MGRRRRGATGSELLARLSPCEREVLAHVALGRHVPDIAARLGLSPRTVETVLRRVRTKLGLRDRVKLARFAMRTGLVTPYDANGDESTPNDTRPDAPT
jgi:DNA-binding NarL/FixJ family response regulator